MFTAEDVQRAIDAVFPEDERSEALAALNEYCHYDYFAGPRVQMAILAIALLSPARERLAAIREGVQMANIDPRDVLAAAEYPDQVGASQTRQQMRQAYRALGVRRSPV